MKIAILVYPGMTALDAIGPYEVLNSINGVELQFVWKEAGPVMTDSGVLVLGASHAFAEATAPDVILIPGSSNNTVTMMADTAVLDWIRQAHTHTQFTTSVCSGALILAAAGVLKGHPATTHWAGMSFLPNFGAEPRPHERIVQSGKIITSAGVSAGIDMALCLVSQLQGERQAKIAQLLIEYDPQPPFNCGHMSKAEPDIQKQAAKEMRLRALNRRDFISVPKMVWQQWRSRVS
jgi:transcriptional regulator GlxA family with amidase domain